MAKESYKKNKVAIPSCQLLLLGENYTEIKAWELKVFLENLVRNVLKENKL